MVEGSESVESEASAVALTVLYSWCVDVYLE